MKYFDLKRILALMGVYVLANCWPYVALAVDLKDSAGSEPNRCLQIFIEPGSNSVGGPGALSPLTNQEIDIILRRLAADPSLKKFSESMKKLMGGPAPLALALKDNTTPDSQFFLSYMRWLAYRSEKKTLATAEENIQRAEIEPALQKTNVMEIFDLLIRYFVEAGEKIPPPVLRLLSELTQSGVERIQVAADRWMLNGKISDIVKTLEYLQNGQRPSSRDLYLAVMKFWELDGGAPVVVQKTLSQFTEEERAYFAELDPNSPLTLPSRNYSSNEVDNIRFDHIGTPLSKLTVEQVDRSVAFGMRNMLPNKKIDALADRYPGRAFKSLTLDEINSALSEMGEKTLMDWAIFMRSDRRMLPGDNTPEFLKNSQSLVPISSPLPPSHALVLAEAASVRNVMAQLPTVKSVVARLDSALAKIDSASLEYKSSVEVYRTYLNIALYAPHDLNVNGSILDVLAVAVVEVGDEADRAAYLDFVSYGSKAVLEKLRAARYDEGERFRNKVVEVYSQAAQRTSWSHASLQSTFREIQALCEDTKDFTTGPEGEEIKRFLAHKTWKGSVRIGQYQVDLRKVDFNMYSNLNGRTLTLTMIQTDEEGSGQYEPILRALAQLAREAGFVVFAVEGVESGDDTGRYWKFFENRMGYQRDSRSADRLRTYFIDL